MSNRMLVFVAALAGFIAYCWHRGQEVQSTRTAVKEDLRRWEGEGGNVPQVATPSPAPVPHTVPQPYSPGGSSSRH